MTDFILPTITTRKRRLVRPEDRKKAMYSCDYCKKKKLGCRRSSSDFELLEPCVKCVQLGIECKTTFKRKKRPQTGPLENVDLHYKCLFFLVKGLFPDVDAASIDSLVELGESLDIIMPSTDGQFMDTFLETFDARDSHTDSDSCPDGSPLVLNQSEKIIIDQGGNHHYIGPFGAPSLIDTCMSVVANNLDTDVKTNAVLLLKSGMIISSQIDKINYNVDFTSFPVIKFSNKSELDHYVDTFFTYVHPSYYCLNETDFRQLYGSFWWLSSTLLKNFILSHAQICCIYTVLLLGREYEPNYPSLHFNTAEILNVIKLCLPTMVLSPSLDSLRCLLLLSVHMDVNRKRETGYFLIELVARQATGMGLNKKSILSTPVPGPTVPTKQLSRFSSKMAEEIKMVWWAIYGYEVSYSLKMGRPSCFKSEDINIGHPTLDKEAKSDPELHIYILQMVRLLQIVYEIVECRKLVKNGVPISNIAILTSLQIIKAAKTWYADMNTAMEPYELTTPGTSSLSIQLKLNYHYYLICLTLPFLLYVTDNVSRGPVPNKYRTLVSQCLNSSVQVTELFQQLYERGLANGSVAGDIFAAYHAAMALTAGYALLENNTTFDMPLSALKDKLLRLQVTLMDFGHKVAGSYTKVVQIIHILANSIASDKVSKITILDLDLKYEADIINQPMFDLEDLAYIMNVTDLLDFDL